MHEDILAFVTSHLGHRFGRFHGSGDSCINCLAIGQGYAESNFAGIFVCYSKVGVRLDGLVIQI